KMVEKFRAEVNADILIVDDVHLNLRMLMQMCSRAGYRVHGADSGEKALVMAREIQPDLILLDIMLPDIDGYEVASRIHSDKRSKDIPIIFISALNDMDSKVKAFTSGGVDYVTKPIRMEEILARVETHLRLRNLNIQLQDELTERESLVNRLNETNVQLQHEVEERRQAERRLESTLKLLQDTLQRTNSMNQIARALIGEETTDDILRLIARNLVTAVPADRIIVATLTENGDALDKYIVEGPGSDLETQTTYEQYMAGLSGWVIEKVQPVISPRNIPDPRESSEEQQERIKRQRGSVIVLPLYYRGNILGTITAINPPTEWDFNEIHMDLIAAVASQTAVARSNLRLASETAFLKQFNEGIVQGVADAILVTDTEMSIRFANPAATGMLGYALSDLIGMEMSSVMSEPGLVGTRVDGVWSLCDGCQGIETLLIPLVGRKISVLLSAQPLLDEGQVSGMLATFTDITELRESTAALERYAADLKAQNAELDAFAHTVAHDLKNPLTSMLGFSTILLERRKDLPEHLLDQYSGYILRSAQTMNNIIRELLLLASVREKEDIPMETILMPDIIEGVLERMQYLISENGAKIDVPEAWPAVTGYGPWVEEVWVNYISNGIKYGGNPDQFIVPHVVLGFDQPVKASTAVRPMVRFWVRDNGPGLTQEDRKALFTPFERLHNVKTEGHGLGLSIVQRIVKKLEGEVGVDSTVGEGSTFYFTLPAGLKKTDPQ
ncbi:MAG: response regulator, partial [Anaerolineales bacterium]